MTRADLTHIYFLLDRSGSMQSIKKDTEGGFAEFLDEQRETPGMCKVTLAQFDDTYDVLYTGVPLADVPPLVLKPRGSTALLDAMGRLITDAGAELDALPENARPGAVIVAVMTDGQENASREWTRPAIKALVEQQTAAYSWQFLYMGADQDAIEVGTNLGIQEDYSVTYGRGKTKQAMATAGSMISGYRVERTVNPNAVMRSYTAKERTDLGS